MSRDLRGADTFGVVTMAFAATDGTSPATVSGGTSTSPTVQLAGDVQGAIAVNYPALGSGTCARALFSIRKAEGCEVTRTCR